MDAPSVVVDIMKIIAPPDGAVKGCRKMEKAGDFS